MNRARGGDDALVVILDEHGFFLPVLQHFQLGRDVVQLFLDLVKVCWHRFSFSLSTSSMRSRTSVSETTLAAALSGEPVPSAQRVRPDPAGHRLGLQLGFIEQMDLMSVLSLLAANCCAFFSRSSSSSSECRYRAVESGLLVCEPLLITCRHRQQFSGVRAADIERCRV